MHPCVHAYTYVHLGLMVLRHDCPRYLLFFEGCIPIYWGQAHMLGYPGMWGCIPNTGVPITSVPKHMGEQSLHVDFFFQEYYQSAGEPLPKLQAACGVREGRSRDTDVQLEINGVLGPWLNSGDRINGEDDDTYDPDRPVVDTTAMLTAAAHGQVVGLPMRFLHHGTLWQLYWHILAHWDALKMCCSEGVKGSRRRSVQREMAAPSFWTFQR